MIPTVSEIENLLTAAILAANGTPPAEYRFEMPVRCGAPGKGPTNRSGMALVKADVGIYYSHVEGETIATVFPGRDVDPAERVRVDTDLARRRAEREKAQAAERAKAIARALERFMAAGPGDGHPYLARKGLASAHGTRRDGDELLVLGRDADGRPAYLERIIGDGKLKLTAKGTSTAGAFVTFGTPAPGSTLVIATGWATSAVLFEEARHPTLAAMSDGNLERVARIAREKYPDADIVIAGDDDRGKAVNSGRKAATAAARAIGARLEFPAFCDACDGSCSDFADTRACKRRRAGGAR